MYLNLTQIQVITGNLLNLPQNASSALLLVEQSEN
jgi:hypothetical protein